ncbi:adenosylcobinamide-GDP ribazoletransferase [Sporosarcina highlanderae]|uniref:Adenosylcobinamide-GDP ribazoletransferase n=1 Tax=Sporosarcina highlanderae TaxID=3035916 RepID=A0ABT8JLL4_9BACL|nr:adenosylcobinamide-GDP ribazoletransferase [Sporosarcina highlanderae]MDN4606038.1 adenosylcobinamide-GDP ribazoletransferase [Sporosarcina highlanderae]
MNGLLLGLQFFTSIPVRKELPMETKDVTRMYIALPFIGGLIGLAMFAVAVLFTDAIGTGPLLAAVFVVLTGIALTGGLHLDGFADVGDAFFSYRDREKRLEILDDPRIGAFGTMAIVLLILVKIALFHELLLRHTEWLPLFLAVPILSRVGMNSYFITTRPAKEKGIAHFFIGKLLKGKLIGWSIFLGTAALTGLGLWLDSITLPVTLGLVLVAGLFLFRRWSLNNFGGVSGDLCGAFIEGMEALLWLAIIICI